MNKWQADIIFMSPYGEERREREGVVEQTGDSRQRVAGLL